MKTNALTPLLPTYDATLERPALCAQPWSTTWLAQKILRQYDRFWHFVGNSPARASNFRELDQVRAHARTLTDIDEHLELMFTEGLLARPRLIVELGVRGGASTFVFERVAEVVNASLISADLDDCASSCSSPRWHFFRGDDVHFSRVFPAFCHQRAINPLIDLLFIDTSHYYDHSVQEISSWFPLLSSRAKVMFHDTNLKPIGPRKDGCFALGWDNQRGVIRAVEEHLGISIDEGKPCTRMAAGWLLRHWSNCNGLTILDRIA
jgi:cephalosporin hydroxylase